MARSNRELVSAPVAVAADTSEFRGASGAPEKRKDPKRAGVAAEDAEEELQRQRRRQRSKSRGDTHGAKNGETWRARKKAERAAQTPHTAANPRPGLPRPEGLKYTANVTRWVLG